MVNDLRLGGMPQKDIDRAILGATGQLPCDCAELAAVKKRCTDATIQNYDTTKAGGKKNKKKKLYNTPGYHGKYCVADAVSILNTLSWGRENDFEDGYLYKCNGKLTPTGQVHLLLIREILGIGPDHGDHAKDTLCAVNTLDVLSVSTEQPSTEASKPFVAPHDSLRRLAARLFWKEIGNMEDPPALIIGAGSIETEELFGMKMQIIFCDGMEAVLAHDLGRTRLRHEYAAKTRFADRDDLGGVDPRSRWSFIKLAGSRHWFQFR
jgi:hypothetical protein